MKVTLNFVKKNILTNLYYRFDFLGMLLILFVTYATNLLFIDELFQYSFSLAGWNKAQLTFLLYTMILSLLITDSFDTSILRFFQKIYHGEGDVFFIKPTSLLNYIFFGWMKNVIPLLIMVTGGIFHFQQVFLDANLMGFVLYFFSLSVGVLTNLLFMANLCCLTFVIKRQIPADFLFAEVSKIMILPFDVFPKKMGILLALFIPSVFSAAIPSAIILKNTYLLFLLQVLGAFIAALVFAYFYHFSLKKYEGLGG